MIRVNTTAGDGRLIVALIDTPEFQRLRRIRQLGLAYFAYQGAEHSRFTHSLGAYQLASRIIDGLAANGSISAADQTAVRAAALLHDIGHGPFSHVIESILSFRHEDFTVRTVLSPETEVGRLLAAYSPELPEKVAAVVQGTFRPRALGQLVSSQLDVDRMDYLLRDSLMTGAKYGIFDLEWVLKSIEIDEEEDRLYISSPGLYAVEDYLQARYYMYRQVYFHRTLRSAEAVLRVLLHRAVDLHRSGECGLSCGGSPMAKVLAGTPLELAEHLAMDDTDVMFSIKQWQHADDAILADLCGRFLDRRLFKALDLEMPDATRAEFIGRVRELVEERGFDPKYYLVEDEARNAPYSIYTSEADPKDLIFVEQRLPRRRMQEISAISAAVRGLQEDHRIRRICFPAEVKDEITELYRNS